MQVFRWVSLSVLLVVAACGGSDEAGDTTEAPPDTDIEAVAESTATTESPETTESSVETTDVVETTVATTEAPTTTAAPTTTIPSIAPPEWNDLSLSEDEYAAIVEYIKQEWFDVDISTTQFDQPALEAFAEVVCGGMSEAGRDWASATEIVLTSLVENGFEGDTAPLLQDAVIQAALHMCYDQALANGADDPQPALPIDGGAPAAIQSIGSGTYVAGTEIAPGFYRVEGYWALLDENQDIIENDRVDRDRPGSTLMSVPESGVAFVEISGRAVSTNDEPFFDPIAEGVTQGVYLVGFDIQPGQYRVTADGRSAYAARLTPEPTGEWDIIDNALNDGSVIMTIQPGDFAFEFEGVLEPIG